jgi:protein involved in plasmid replication-relaxation
MSTGIRYQPRDVKILSLIGELGILDLETIKTRYFLVGESDKACPKKLRQYKKLGLILEHKVEVASKKETRVYFVFRLTREGADEIERLTGVRPKRAGGTNPPDSKTLQHRLGVLHTRLKFDDACQLQELSPLEWIMEWDGDPEAPATAELSERIILNHSFQKSGRRLSCWPDAAFRFQLPDGPCEDLLGYLEYDRSTMDHADMLEKLDGYAELLESRAYLEHWPQVREEHFARVLFVCQSEQRISNLSETYATHQASSFVRFATAASLVPARLFTEPIWRTTDGKLLAILKPCVALC